MRAVAVVADALDEQGRSRQWLADQIEVSRSQVSRILDGLKPVTLSEVERMCVALGLDILDVIRRAQ